MEKLRADVSGNVPTTDISGNVPEDMHPETFTESPEQEGISAGGVEEGTVMETAAIVEAVHEQTAVIRDGFIVCCIFLGLLAGFVLIKGLWIGKG